MNNRNGQEQKPTSLDPKRTPINYESQVIVIKKAEKGRGTEGLPDDSSNCENFCHKIVQNGNTTEPIEYRFKRNLQRLKTNCDQNIEIFDRWRHHNDEFVS